MTVVYAMNEFSERIPMWTELMSWGRDVSKPWLLVADFNNPLHLDDRVGKPVT